MVLEILIAAIATEAITEILVDSKLFEPIRKYIAIKAFPDVPENNSIYLFLYKLTSCGYCLSVWVSAIVVYSMMYNQMITNNNLIKWAILVFVIHRLANIFHVGIQVFTKGRVISLDVEMKMKESENE